MKSFQVMRTHLSPYQHKNFVESEKKALEALGGIHYIHEDHPEAKDLILITNTHTDLAKLSRETLNRTRLIIHPNSGYDNFTKDHSLWSQIPVVVGHTIRAQAVIEYTMGALFQASQELPQHLSWDKNRNWNRKLIQESRIWIYGNGHIGSKVAATVKSLGAEVTIIDPFQKGFQTHWKNADRSQVDVHLLCASLNPSSYHLLNQEFFEELSPDAIIINGARGQLIDEKALRVFLQKNPSAQAFLDVFEEEPFGSEWHHFPQVWKTSHIAGVSRSLDQKILEFEVEVLKEFQQHPQNFLEKYKHELLQNKFVGGVLI